MRGCHYDVMNDYVIGAGAVLTTGDAGTITGATLHAQTDPAIAAQVRAAIVDFESSDLASLSKIVILATGWNARRFESSVVSRLVSRESHSLADVISILADAAGTRELHLFARWYPDDVMSAALRRAQITVVAHPLEAIECAALISGQRCTRWPSPLRAA